MESFKGIDMKKVINVICIKWGNAYDANYVNTLKNMIKRHTSYTFDFYCFTEDSEGLDEDIIIKPLPVLNTIKENEQSGSRKDLQRATGNQRGSSVEKNGVVE